MALKVTLLKRIFSTRRGEWIIFIFSLLLAFFMWSIQRFSQKYTTYVNYQIVVEAPLSGRAQSNISKDLLLVKGRCSGFYVLKQYFTSNNNPRLKIELNSNQLYRLDANSDLFYVRSSQISSKIQDAIGQDFECEGFITDTLFFSIPIESYKKVPVVVNSSLEYMGQFMPLNNISLKPDSILIYGEAATIGRVDSLYTKLISKSAINADISGIVELKSIKGITMSEKEVYYSQRVVRYVESSVMLPVSILNLPENINMTLLPSMVKVKYRAPFGAENKITASDFLVAVDYNQIESVGGGVKPFIVREPKGVFGVVIDPIFVESIVLN